MEIVLALCIGYVFGMLHLYNKEKLGAALGVIFGKRPALAGHADVAPIFPDAGKNLKQAAPTIGTVLKNFGQFFAWCFRNWLPILCVICVLVIIWGLMWLGDYFGLGKSKAEVRRDAQRNEQTLDARNETTIAGFEEGESFREDRRAIEDELARGNEALESIPSETSDLDFLRQWRDLDNGLLNAGSLAR